MHPHLMVKIQHRNLLSQLRHNFSNYQCQRLLENQKKLINNEQLLVQSKFNKIYNWQLA